MARTYIKINREELRPRNRFATDARFRSGAGVHVNKGKRDLRKEIAISCCEISARYGDCLCDDQEEQEETQVCG